MSHFRPPVFAITFAVTLAALAWGCASQPTPAPAPAPAPTTGARPPAAPGDPAARPQQDTAASGGPRPAGGSVRPYARVITSDAKTSRGLFKTHMIGERLYYEIPRRELNRDQLLLARRTGLGGFGNLIVRWERSGNRILLRQYSYASLADTALPIYRAVAPLEQGPILASFAIETWGPDSAAVVEVTRLFTSNIPELGGPSQMVPDRTFIESVGAYPTNIEVEATQTGIAAPAGGAPQFPGAPAPRPTTVTQRMHYSMLRLPEQPMMPRLQDDRVGYISTALIDYGSPEHRSATRRYINRFRLEKKDPGAAVSEPLKQIVFWIDPATPKWMVPWVKKAVEDWQPAYEAAGFKNAIVAKEAPTPAEDPYWSPDDASRSIIHWRASTIANANGGQVVDPRTGEILKAEVQVFHNIMNLQRDWYFVQVGPLDPRARKLPLPDSLMGRLVEYVIAHEVGHSIGFPHNMKASAMYPADSIRSATFLRKMGGHVATLMDYSRFNYVAQPEDKIPVDLLIPGVGPYDIFAIKWGHTPIPGVRTPDEELPTLDKWASVQDTVPWFRYETPDAQGDPESLTEAVGDADAAKSSTLGLKNLKRVMAMLRPVAERPGEDYSMLNELYDEVVTQWSRYMGHVAAIVGGSQSQERYGTGARFTPMSKSRQRDALRFLEANAFQVPSFLIDKEILTRIEQEGIVGQMRTAQNQVLSTVLSEGRLNRLLEHEALATDPKDVYTIGDLMSDLRRGVWSELSLPSVKVDIFRRNLQRAYLEAMDRDINPPPAAAAAPRPPGFPPLPPRYASDVRPLLRGELIELDRVIARALGKTSDAVTRLHLQDVRLQIDRTLNPDRTRR